MLKTRYYRVSFPASCLIGDGGFNLLKIIWGLCQIEIIDTKFCKLVTTWMSISKLLSIPTHWPSG